MKNIILLLLVTLNFATQCEKNLDKTLNYHSRNAPKEPQEQSRCAHHYGSSLIACLRGACDKPQLKKDLLLLDIEQKNEYVRNLKGKKDYEEFFDLFLEKEYQEFIGKLGQELQRKLPQNKKEQKELLASFRSWKDTAYYIGERAAYVALGAGIVVVCVVKPEIGLPALVLGATEKKNKNNLQA